VCTFAGTTSIPVTCSGTLAGLGDEDLNLRLSVSGFALYQWQNGGDNTARGIPARHDPDLPLRRVEPERADQPGDA